MATALVAQQQKMTNQSFTFALLLALENESKGPHICLPELYGKPVLSIDYHYAWDP